MKTLCQKCDTRLPKYKEKLICSHCDSTFCNKCQLLSKGDVKTIIKTGYITYWTCQQCTSDMFPLHNDYSLTIQSDNIKTDKSRANEKQKCHTCSKLTGIASAQECHLCGLISHAPRCMVGE